MRSAGILLLVALAALGVSYLKWRDLLGPDPLRRPPLPDLSRETHFSLKISPVMQPKLGRPLPAAMRCRGPRHKCLRQIEGETGLRVIPYWGAMSTAYVGATEIDVDVGGLRPLDALLRVADEKRDGPAAAALVYDRQVVLSTPE